MRAPRGRFNISSTNLSRESSMLSKASSIKYSAYIEAQSADPNWANQTEEELFRLSYAMPLGGESNIYDQTNNSDSMPLPHVGHAHNMQSQVPAINSGISSLSYEELQLGNPNL